VSKTRGWPRAGLDWAHRLVATLLFLHFLFMLALVQHVSLAALFSFTLCLLMLVPPARRRLAQLPGVGAGWVRALGLLLLLGLANSLLVGGDRPEIARGPYAFVGATIITGYEDRDAIENGVVLVDAKGKIVEVGPASRVALRADYERVDVAGKYLMPGLINAHGHLLLSGRPAGEPIELGNFNLPDWLVASLSWFMQTYPGEQLVLWQMGRSIRQALAGGVTTLRGLGDPNFLDVELRDRVESGGASGPRLLVSGPIICTTGGHAHQIGQIIDGPDEARRAVRNALLHRVDHIKIASTGGVSDARRIGEAGELQMTPAEIEAVTDEAHRKHVLVAAHAESSLGVLEALRAGVDSIEHGARLDAEAIALFKDNPRALRGYTTFHPTLSVIAGEMQITDQVREDPALFVLYTNGSRIREEMMAGFAQALAGGVAIAVGTDAGIVAHGDVWKEMKFFVEMGGVSRSKAIHWGTLGTARSIGIDDVTGSVERGKWADFVIVDGDPTHDLSTLASPAMVVAAGRIHRPD
jgi:imidazolonepropionase-like amidohydrolase